MIDFEGAVMWLFVCESHRESIHVAVMTLLPCHLQATCVN